MQLEERKKEKKINKSQKTDKVSSPLIASCFAGAVGDSKRMLTPTVTQKGPYFVQKAV